MKLTENHNLSADIRDANGNQKVMLHASYGARTFSLTVETLDKAYVKKAKAAAPAESEAPKKRTRKRAAKPAEEPKAETTETGANE